VNARDAILGRLKKAPRESRQPERLGDFQARAPGKDGLTERFIERLKQNSAMVILEKESGDVGSALLKALQSEGIERVVLTRAADALLGPAFQEAMQTSGVVGTLAPEDEEGLKRAAFQAYAGVSVAKWGVSELGALALVHGKENPRLLSLAPPLSVIVLKAGSILEDLRALAIALAPPLAMPSQVTLVSGPSQSADIQGVPFFGMHGPKKLLAVVLQDGPSKEG